MRGPALSVVIPVRNDPANLGRCLTALGAAMRTNFEVEGELVSDEIIVVDDGSTDETADVARRFGVRLMQHDARRGPAAARNHGSEIATNPVLFFVDADVRVAPDTLERVARQARGSPEFEAFFGSYDDQPGAPSLVSQYRNLQHHFVHQTGNAEATTFWSGCGAIWRSTFLKLGGFDTGYRGASIEDIELGGRLRQAGHRIALVKDIQVQHLKRWTYGSMVHCDIFKRGIPWTRLIRRQGAIPNDLNLRHSQRLSALLAVATFGLLVVGAMFHSSLIALPLMVIGVLVAIDRWTDRPPRPDWLNGLAGLVLVAGLVALVVATPIGRGVWSLWALGSGLALGGIVALNLPFYRFLARTKGLVFMALSIPLHVTYYLSSVVAFGIGTLLHLVQPARGT